MSYRGPKAKKARRLGVAVSAKTQKYLEKRPYAPGQHGRNRRAKLSDYGRQLQEKQRLRFQYNISEGQLRRNYKKASSREGSTPDILIQLLETRLDAIVFRAGLARSIFAARQYVRHGHFMVNGQKVDIPSFHVKPGDEIKVRDKSLGMECFQYALQTSERVPYITTDEANLTVKLNYVPLPEEIPVQCNIPVVVEYYSR